MRARLAILAFALVQTASLGPAAAHPPPPPDDYYYSHPPQLIVAPTVKGPKPRGVLEAQLGGGVGRWASSNAQWFGFSLGYHKTRTNLDWLSGNERGADVDLRVNEARGGTGVIVGVRPALRHIDGDWRVPSLAGVLAPELAVSIGRGRQNAYLVEWSLPIAISIGKSNALEWNVVRAGVVFAADGTHASFGTELRFVLR